MLLPEEVRHEIRRGGGLTHRRLLKELGDFTLRNPRFARGEIDQLDCTVCETEYFVDEEEQIIVGTELGFSAIRQCKGSNRRRDLYYQLFAEVERTGDRMPGHFALQTYGGIVGDDVEAAVEAAGDTTVRRRLEIFVPCLGQCVTQREEYHFLDCADNLLGSAYAYGTGEDSTAELEGFGSFWDDDDSEWAPVGVGRHDVLTIDSSEEALKQWDMDYRLARLWAEHAERQTDEALRVAFSIFYGLRIGLERQVGIR